jgi:hypothetical protein
LLRHGIDYAWRRGKEAAYRDGSPFHERDFVYARDHVYALDTLVSSDFAVKDAAKELSACQRPKTHS